jgi:hypothetical protein
VTDTSGPPARRSRSWVPVVVGLAAACAVLLIALIAFGAFFYTRHVQIGTTANEPAREEFAAVRQRFAGEQPLVELREDGVQLHQRTARPSDRKIQTVRVLAWNPDDHRIVRVDVPMWLVRMKGSMPGISILDTGPQLTAEDIERHGPGLIVDHATPDGKQVIVWAE